MQFRLADLDLRWTGTDDTTPPGHVTALGFDPLGNYRLFLWAGDTPSDDQYAGSILIPQDVNAMSIAYGPRGGFVGILGTEAEKLARLANAR